MYTNSLSTLRVPVRNSSEYCTTVLRATIVTFVCLGVIFFISLRQESHIKNKGEMSQLFGQSVTNDTSTIG